MGYAAGGGGGGGSRGRFLALLLAGVATAGLALGHGRGPLPGATDVRADEALAARNLVSATVQTVWIAYEGADGKRSVLRRPIPVSLDGQDEGAWRRAFPGFDVRPQGTHVLLTPRPGQAAFEIRIDRGQVVIGVGQRELGVIVERTPLLAGTLPLAVRSRLYAGVRVASVPDAWRMIVHWTA